MAVILQLRRDTAANWTSENPTLAEGELGIETDTLAYKLGDGSTAWNSLAYAQLSGAIGTTAGLPIKTGTAGVLEVGAFGTSAGQFAEGNHTHTGVYQPADTQLTDLAALSYSSNALKVVRVNAGATAFELATVSGSGDALVANTLDQFADVTQTAGQTLAITSSTTLSGGTHSGTNTGDQTTIVGITGTKAQFDTACTDGNFAYVGDAPTSHTHGNITNAGAIGSTANLPVITTTSGVLTVGAFGTGATDFCVGNDSRLSDARTPTAHTHGNITNAGAIGSTANLPVITTTSGVLTVGAFGTGATDFCVGNDARLSDSRTPTSHTHGNITNVGAIGSTSGLPIKTGTSGVLEAGAFGTGAGQFAEGNHDHSGVYQPLDTQLTDLAALSYGSNALKVVRVNSGETAFELATVSGSADPIPSVAAHPHFLPAF